MELRRYLKDPVWAGIGGLVGIIAVFLAVWQLIPPDMHPRLTVTASTRYLKEDYELLRAVGVNIEFNGKPLNAYRVDRVQLSNDGPRPIRVDDYLEPITVSVPLGNRLIGIAAAPREQFGRKLEGSLFEWTKLSDEKFAAKPVALNRYDSETLLVVSAPTVGKTFDLFFEQEPQWSGKLADGKFRVITLDDRMNEFSSFLAISISHSGIEVYLLVIIGTGLTCVLLRLSSRYVGSLSWKRIVWISSVSLLSFAAAEVITDFLDGFSTRQHFMATVTLLCFAGVVFWLVWKNWRDRQIRDEIPESTK